MNPMPFKEAVDYFKNKATLSEPQFRKLASEMGDRVHSLAFSVNGIARADVLTDMHQAVLKAISEGKTFGDWRKRVDGIMEARGWEGLSPSRLNTIFRTNIQSAYSAGRYAQMKAIADRRPYWQYDAVNDGRTRPSHLAMDGKVYHHDHPIWNTWVPPNGYNCRCRLVSLSPEEVQEEGLEVETRGTDLKPDEGFGFNPAVQSWRPDLQKYAANIRQGFLEEQLDRTCPDDWANFAESACYARLKKQINQKDLTDMETLIWARKQGGVEGYADWVEEVLKRPEKKAVLGELYPVGNLPGRVCEAAKPRLALVIADDYAIVHARDVNKDLRGAALTKEELQAIPRKFPEATWYLDKEDPALLMCWERVGSVWLKVVVRIDQKISKRGGVANLIKTAGVVEDYNLAVDPRYKKI